MEAGFSSELWGAFLSSTANILQCNEVYCSSDVKNTVIYYLKTRNQPTVAWKYCIDLANIARIWVASPQSESPLVFTVDTSHATRFDGGILIQSCIEVLPQSIPKSCD